jgi:hypothetical protein
LNWASLDDAELVRRLARWRSAAMNGLTTRFRVTRRGTAAWLERVLRTPDRIVFLVWCRGRTVGQVGLANFDYGASQCYVDGIIRGDPRAPKGVMRAAIETMLGWSYRELKAK